MRFAPGMVGNRQSSVTRRTILQIVLLALFGLAGWFPDAAASAQTVTPRLIPLSQRRYVNVQAYSADLHGHQQDSDRTASRTFGSFDADISANTVMSNAFAFANAVQHSALQPAQISASGHAIANVTVAVPEEETAVAQASSFFSVTFRANLATQVRLQGAIGLGFGGGSTAVELAGPDGVLFATSDDNQTFDIVAMLKRGARYTLSAQGLGGAGTSPYESVVDTSGTYSLTLSLVPMVREFTTLSQVRTISSHALAVSGSSIRHNQYGEAPDAAPWSASVRSAARHGGAKAYATSTQTSEIGPTSAGASSRAVAIGSAQNAGEYGGGSADSAFEMRFFVGAPTGVRLKGRAGYQLDGAGEAVVRVSLSDDVGVQGHRLKPCLLRPNPQQSTIL